MSEVEKLINLAKNAAEKILKYQFVRLISHNDADGLTSAGIMAQALLRAGIRFQLSIAARLDEAVIEEVNGSTSPGELVIFCDMGSGYSDLVGKVAVDVVVLDPPKFATSKGRLMKAARGYKDIILLGMKLLKPGGILATFSCSGLMTPDLFHKVVSDAAVDAGRDVQVLKRLQQGSDHPEGLCFPEGLYLKGLLCRVN